MAKCNNCGKRGLFLKVNPMGLCSNCEINRALEQRENELRNSITTLEAQLADREAFRASIANQAKEEALGEIESQLQTKRQQLDTFVQTLSKHQQHCDEVLEKAEKAEKTIESSKRRAKKAKDILKNIQYAMERYDSSDELSLGDIPLLEKELGEVLGPEVEIKLHSMDVRELRKQFNQNKKDIQAVLNRYKGRYTTKANAALYSLMVLALEAELQNVLYNIKYGKLDTSIDLIKKMTAKYQAIASEGNQNIAPTMVKFIGEIEGLFIKAVEIEYEYYVQKERIKEQQQALREQMRQEAEERKELERQRMQVEKEESKYLVEIDGIKEQLESPFIFPMIK